MVEASPERSKVKAELNLANFADLIPRNRPTFEAFRIQYSEWDYWLISGPEMGIRNEFLSQIKIPQADSMTVVR